MYPCGKGMRAYNVQKLCFSTESSKTKKEPSRGLKEPSWRRRWVLKWIAGLTDTN